jgi:hypothetical protein
MILDYFLAGEEYSRPEITIIYVTMLAVNKNNTHEKPGERG